MTEIIEAAQSGEAKNVLETALATEGAEAAADYDIKAADDIFKSDPRVNERLKAAGFTNEQAQLVYDLASEVTLPIIARIIHDFKTARELERLERHFGGEERFDEIARQITTWAEKNLPRDVFDALNSSYQGVVALYNMMAPTEPRIESGSGEAAPALTDRKLREMMRDPRYWRDGDKDFIRRVDEGFKSLYREEE